MMNQNRTKRAREKRFSLLLARLATIFATPFNPFGYNDKFYLVFFPLWTFRFFFLYSKTDLATKSVAKKKLMPDVYH